MTQDHIPDAGKKVGQDCEPVVVIGSGWQLLWVDPVSMAEIAEKHGLRIGSTLYTAPPKREPLSDEQIEQGRKQTFSTENPFCPCDSKTMRKAVRWAERAHKIGGQS